MNNTLSTQSIAIDCLNSTKYLILRDSYGTMESASPQIRQVFSDMTIDHLKMAEDWFRLMENRGWYKIAQASSGLINQSYNHLQSLEKETLSEHENTKYNIQYNQYY